MVKLYNSQEKLFNCHIQEMGPNHDSCIVFVEELAEKCSVSYSNLHPSSIDIKPLSAMVKRCGDGVANIDKKRKHNASTIAIDSSDSMQTMRHIQKKKHLTFGKARKYADDVIESDSIHAIAIDSSCRNVDKIYNLQQYTDLSHFQPYSFDLVAMPLTLYRPHVVPKNSMSSQPPSNQPQIMNGRSSSNLNHSPMDKPKGEIEQHQVNHAAESFVPQHQMIVHQQQPPMVEHFDANGQVTVPPPPPPMPFVNGNGVVYYYPAPECSNDQNYYSVPPEVPTPQHVYTVSPQPYPMSIPQPYVTQPFQMNPMYSVPMNGWPSATGVPSKFSFSKWMIL